MNVVELARRFRVFLRSLVHRQSTDSQGFRLVPEGFTVPGEQSELAKADSTIAELTSYDLELLADMSGRRLSSLPAPTGEPANIAFQVRVFAQSSLWRSMDLAESCLTLFDKGRYIAALITARGLIESVASFCYFEKELSKRASDQSAEGLKELKSFIVNFSFSGRLKEIVDGHPEAEATQILKQIDRLSKSSKEERIRDTYDHLCEYTHPNSYGCVMAYSDLRAGGDVKFSNSKVAEFSKFHILKSIYLLRHFREALDRLEAYLGRLES